METPFTEKQKRGQLIGAVVTTLLLVAAFLYLLMLYPKRDALAFQEEACAFSRTLHLYCPGCGGTRAIMYLLKGDLLRSLLANPIPVYSGILVLRIWIALLHNVVILKFQKEGKKWTILHQWEMWGILIVIGGAFILRNLALVLLHLDFLGDLKMYW